jgi:hypothetical protein
VQQQLQSRSGALAYYLDQTRPDPTLAGLDSPTIRRWAIWSARFGLLGGLVGAGWGVWVALGDTAGREWLVMSGLAGVVLVTLFLMWAHEAATQAGSIPRMRLVRSAMTLGASCVALGVFMAGKQADAVHVLTKVAHLPRALSAARDAAGRLGIDHDHIALLPRFSAKMSGATQAPVSLIFLGGGAELLEVFARARWHAAERVTVRSAVRACRCGLLNRPYPTAPVFPSFLHGKLHDVAFQKTHAGGSPTSPARASRCGWPPLRMTRESGWGASFPCPSTTSIRTSTPSVTISFARSQVPAVSG